MPISFKPGPQEETLQAGREGPGWCMGTCGRGRQLLGPHTGGPESLIYFVGGTKAL